MSIIAVCGYRGHGKDTLYRAFRDMVNYKNPRYEFHIHHPLQAKKLMSRLLSHPRILRFASADRIKYQMCEMYGMTYEELEKKKDRPIENQGKTYRDVMKSIARECLKKDTLHFVKKIEECEIDPETTIVVTDLRMKHEHEYLKELAKRKGLEYATVRVFRSNASIPDLEDTSEHGLDDLVTDYFVSSSIGCINSFTAYLNIDDYFDRSEECTRSES